MKYFGLLSIGAVVVLAIFGVWKLNQGEQMHQQPVKILFPTDILIAGPALMDPNNTESIFEYYLLENLACGLVKDSSQSPTGYEGCLAKKFYQENEYTWVFELNSLRWSDGAEVAESEIKDWLKDLTSGSKRHVQFLKLVKSFYYSHAMRTLKLVFPFPVDTTILHELSLADASLLPSNFKTSGWSRTIGPYSVSMWDKEAKSLKLIANQFSPLFREGMPMEALLEPLKNPEDINNVFTALAFDVVLLNSTTSPERSRVILKNTPQVFEAHPTSIVFFVVNYANQEAKSIGKRRQFAAAIAKVRESVEAATAGSSPFLPETQLIPDGFVGRLSKPIDLEIDAKSPHDLKLVTVKAHPAFADYTNLMNKMKDEFKKVGISLHFSYSTSGDFSDDEFAKIYTFVGNQLDSSGTWSFLAGPPNGLLSPWYAEYKIPFESVFHSENISERQNNLKLLHKTVLESVIAVPLMVGRQRYLLSQKIDASKWSKFDARLRIYDLKWK
jgi:hypothetical protein